MHLSSIGTFLVNLPRATKRLIVLAFDCALAVTTTWLAFCVRFDEVIEISYPLVFASSVALILFIPIFVKNGLYRAIYRYSGWFATIALARSFSIYAAIYFFIFAVVNFYGVPRSVGLIQPVLFFVCSGILRLAAKALLNKEVLPNRAQSAKSLALIYGAGVAGRQLASGLRQSNEIKPYAFIDDNPNYWNSTINGLNVYAPSEVGKLISSGVGISDILLAIPTASRSRQREILELLSDYEIKVRILPGLSNLANGIVKVEDVRAVEIEDVLGREPVVPNRELMGININGKVVAVTGAGGSIGSELCRQIINQEPVVLILYELNEFALYSIDRELSQKLPKTKVVPILGSVLDHRKLVRVIRKFKVQTLYHAAAYKHVPMIELNPIAGVWNNIFGTLRTVEAACQEGVETFVLVSTDKAVRPTNVMGCTKRFSELILQAKNLQENNLSLCATKLTMVRFGNVLGSSGSVIPVFREQIKSGGPVTVTHPEIIRYFMTIPEAAQLVIQAGTIGEGGDVMVLDMGEPVKVVDLAKRMIHLSGFSYKEAGVESGDIQIEFTGLRPGEKLYEELLIGDNTLPTSHPRIMRAQEHALDWSKLELLLTEMELAVKANDSAMLRLILKRGVPEYTPESENNDILK